MLENYFSVLVFILVGLAFGCMPILMGRFVAPHRPDAEKLSAFECGFEPFEDARMKFDVRYYLIAIIFTGNSQYACGQVFWFHRNVCVYGYFGGWLHLCLGQGRFGLGMRVHDEY